VTIAESHDQTRTRHAQDEFARLGEPHRRELLVHCYRMLGSLHDAEDLVQEVYLRAWRSYDDFEGRASFRTWLYRIATNACLNALQHSSRRVLPSGLGRPSDNPRATLSSDTEIPWLEPLPDRLFAAARDGDPAVVVTSRAGIRLAVVAALQHLPPRQRAVLLLRETLGLPAAQIAEQLGITAAAVNSSLQRARTRIDELAPASEQIAEPTDPDSRALLDRYQTAFEHADIAALTELYTQDAVMDMPPAPEWFAGRQAIADFFSVRLPHEGDSRLIRTAANGQPAFAAYFRLADGNYEAKNVQVFTISHGLIRRVSAFRGARIFEAFDLPPILTRDALHAADSPAPRTGG